MTTKNRGKPRPKVDSVRASRDGHAYHEAWAVRSALELLPPKTTLTAIALEGFSIEDSPGLSDATIEIADLVRYHGSTSFASASRVEVVQFKYSIAKAETAVRAADITSTLEKFAKAEIDFRSRFEPSIVDRVARFTIATNQPIHPNLIRAIKALRESRVVEGDVAHQADQVSDAIKALGTSKGRFLDRLELSGHRGSLSDVDLSTHRLLAHWGVGSDPESEMRLRNLRSLVRTKAGFEGAGNNVIDRVAILAELHIASEDTLYPTPDAFPAVGQVIDRQVVADVAVGIIDGAQPLIVHSVGGRGKTVLLQSVAQRLGDYDYVVSFDGYGAGKWRDPSDARHLPERSLVHLANLLAGRGFCDILLPIGDEISLLPLFATG